MLKQWKNTPSLNISVSCLRVFVPPLTDGLEPTVFEFVFLGTEPLCFWNQSLHFLSSSLEEQSWKFILLTLSLSHSRTQRRTRQHFHCSSVVSSQKPWLGEKFLLVFGRGPPLFRPEHHFRKCSRITLKRVLSTTLNKWLKTQNVTKIKTVAGFHHAGWKCGFKELKEKSLARRLQPVKCGSRAIDFSCVVRLCFKKCLVVGVRKIPLLSVSVSVLQV